MRILIVEDDKKVGAFLERGLKEEQYAVDVCRDGEEAMDLAMVNPPMTSSSSTSCFPKKTASPSAANCAKPES